VVLQKAKSTFVKQGNLLMDSVGPTVTSRLFQGLQDIEQQRGVVNILFNVQLAAISLHFMLNGHRIGGNLVRIKIY
jgi:hypothetical protein